MLGAGSPKQRIGSIMRAADVIAKRLYAQGCRWAFGMPGGEVLTLLDALDNGLTVEILKIYGKYFFITGFFFYFEAADITFAF